MSEMLNEVIKSWSGGRLEYGSVIKVPHGNSADFDTEGLTPLQLVGLETDFGNSFAVNFKQKSVSYYEMVPTKIVGVTTMFTNQKQFHLQGTGWGRTILVSEALEGAKFNVYQKQQNDKVNNFLSRLAELKGENA